MNSKIIIIAKDEWRYWYRSKLAITMLVLTMALTLASVVITGLSLTHASHDRAHLQEKAEDAFVSQPDKHPHRMVHYGHYVFRTPSPLSVIDPGIDTYTGTSIFLEGHKQNSDMFGQQQQSSGLTRFSQLTPAFVMQVLAPLLLILMGYSVVSRERESCTLTYIVVQGTPLTTFILGKCLALLSVSLLLLAPLVIGSFITLGHGETLSVILPFIATHSLYLLIWCYLVVLVSTLNAKNTTSFTTLIILWVLFCLVIPRISASTASSIIESPSKLEADFEVIEHVIKLGDGHNVSNEDFNKIKANLLTQYKVDNVEQLPVNIRGIISRNAEANLTVVLQEFAEKRMAEELAQAKIARQFGWLTPVLALRTASMMLAGTNLETHHRFLREAEALRFDFVQGLNTVHAEKLSYTADVNRNKSEEAYKKSLVSSANWQLLKDFHFEPDQASTRLLKGAIPFIQLGTWILILLVLATRAKKVLQ